ncbi:MAG TPA: ribosome biogenesis GTP-binding protein YihA/YsxC [Bacteroidales bacterium]|jgi:GTP-binding protein|nr:YihA family ribosome biogenesis GTP-binding protein [Bacteroidales bacterium]OQB61944.1 MAG: putative GTP-binding protein EngB [Bacteroidetes bacterium ADurb.Bin145]HOU01912.1 ribosome biogenesis GTP-binding protein YihA/YsxC [Bacteroidales bacterium]HQG62593.1 ribosome biogenesis GTP-binding protein YihA/YsxC [Bacteroidales bacterium]HQK67314.1 ribosome biogenesis GTP-binding protein YihA/YsxC [Bacteroidales bacterium]
MLIRSASFVKSSATLKQCPDSGLPEFGFIGRSNVGKSSLINMLTGWSRLARISAEPGKTRTINHYLINSSWHLVDLPGYGYARVPVKMREKWLKTSRDYITKRETLICLFVLIDSRLEPQRSDLEFMEFLGMNGIPFARVFTKSDKLSGSALRKSVQRYDSEMLKIWETLPPTFISSTIKRTGREAILNFIEESINNLQKGS